jgi:hypothetical protein
LQRHAKGDLHVAGQSIALGAKRIGLPTSEKQEENFTWSLAEAVLIAMIIQWLRLVEWNHMLTLSAWVLKSVVAQLQVVVDASPNRSNTLQIKLQE